ncbi:hypothetical protein ABIC47_003762 [Leifsonia sp. 563]|uniref:hypothetical protein n=1 Tax=Leifsonia sp. 563 TaxID=3156412 RepID=UPI0033999974
MSSHHINARHAELLNAALRAPSVHNAQPWGVKPLPDGSSYELHYDQNEYLPDDPDDRDAMLTMGAFAETLVLEAPNWQLAAEVTTTMTRIGTDWHVANIRLVDDPTASPGELGAAVARRRTNRNRYTCEPLPGDLEEKLAALGNVIVPPGRLVPLVAEASRRNWGDAAFVTGLKLWFRDDLSAEEGFTAPQMKLSRLDVAALRFAFRRGRLSSSLLQRIYSTRDISMFRSAPAAAVLGARSLDPLDLFDAGRRLLRSWVTIAAAGFDCHPFSIAIDDPTTARRVGAEVGVATPVALYRIGRCSVPPYGSNRKSLDSVSIT